MVKGKFNIFLQNAMVDALSHPLRKEKKKRVFVLFRLGKIKKLNFS